ncbi:4'-phosphopantetheinyl transferase superfamily protein [Streptomyces sp. NRRL B-1677]|uniref:4'-phosphopantetheinyl transferase family protein n=1 Tax=Streptomyces sp. NRRL B-1677 TaxID=2682966 RepID=UPI00189292DA|nr:4'-phosphopantetheinyl transferase superfamily protein [Streptomyces sp. NRRL B-1677]MBF6043672.1 4'-phosphopantetheinyl transferase superfamily protein [Streptomyces sp. NRRL B-1677]
MGVSGGPGIRPRALGEDPLPGEWTPGGPPHVWLLHLAGLRPGGFTDEGPGAGVLRGAGLGTGVPANGALLDDGPRPGAVPGEEVPYGDLRPGAAGLPDDGPQAARSPLDAALRDHARILDPAERDRAAAFVRDLHRNRYIASHVGLRLLLGAYLATDPAAVVLVREPCPGCGGPHGRPAAAGAPLHFNLSHAGDLALFAFADTPVGADVEQLQPAEVVDEVARVLHPDETAELAALPAALRPEAFARCWTRKEAYLKGTGTGLSENPSVTYVGAGPAPASPAGWTLTDVTAPPGYAAAVAVANARGPHLP